MADDPRLNVPSPLTHPAFDSRFGGDPAQQAESEAAQHHKKEADEQDRQAEQARKAGEEVQAAKREPLARLRQTLSAPHEPIPTAQPLPEPPKPEDYRKYSMEFVGAMAAFGAFAGKKMRGTANAGLKSFTAALNGWQEGNAQAYRDATLQWKEQTERLLEMNQQQMQRYRAVMQDRSLTVEEQMDQLKLASMEAEDRIMYDATAAKNSNAAGQALDIRASTTRKLEDSFHKQVELLTNEDQSVVPRARQTRDWLATPQGQAWDQQLSQNSPGEHLRLHGWLDVYAKAKPAPQFTGAEEGATGTGGVPGVEPPPGTPMDTSTTPEEPPDMPGDLYGPVPAGMKGPQMAERSFRQRIWRDKGREPDDQDWSRFNRQQHPAKTGGALSLQEFIDETIAATGKPPSSHDLIHYDAERTGAISEARLGGTMAQRVSVAADEVAMAMPPALQASKTLPRGKIVPFNQLIQQWEKGTSDVRYNEFMVTNLSLLNAYVRAMNPQGIPRIAERAETHAVGLLSMATDQASYEAQARKIWVEVQRMKQAVAMSRSGEMPPNPFDDAAVTTGAPAGGGAGKGDPAGIR